VKCLVENCSTSLGELELLATLGKVANLFGVNVAKCYGSVYFDFRARRVEESRCSKVNRGSFANVGNEV
jgi:hypothetical protein